MDKLLPTNLYISYFPTGSNYICDPPVTDTDIDYAVYVKDINTAMRYLEKNGWKVCGGNSYPLEEWAAYRKDQYNLILFADWKAYVRFEAATELCKKRNVLEKEDRIELFNLICQQDNVTTTLEQQKFAL